MSYYIHDPDEWENITESGSFAPAAQGMPSMGWFTSGQRRRAPEDVAKIKERKRIEREDAILAEADAIRARRGHDGW